MTTTHIQNSVRIFFRLHIFYARGDFAEYNIYLGYADISSAYSLTREYVYCIVV